MKNSFFLILVVALLCTIVDSEHPCVASRFPAPFQTQEQRTQWGKRNQKFGRIWLTRHQNPKKAALAILPFVREKVDQNADLRIRAIIALGRIESPIAQKPLQKLLEETVATQKQRADGIAWIDNIPQWRIQFALARIQSRDLRGKARLEFVAKALGTTWPKIRTLGVQWRAKVQGPQSRDGIYDFLRKSPKVMLEEFAQLLHDMGKQGQNIKALGANDLLVWSDSPNLPSALYSSQQALILTAHMTREQEIRFWLLRSTPPHVGTMSPQAFLDLGPPAVQALKVALAQLLPKAIADPKIVADVNGIGCQTLFKAAAASCDQSFIPLLEKFQDVKDRWVYAEATQAIADLKSGEGAWMLPVRLNAPA